MTLTEFFYAFIGTVLSLMVFSYLLGDNLFFGIAMYILVGMTAGYVAAVVFTKVILPMLILPLGELPSISALLTLVPLLLSALLIWMFFKKSAKVSGIALGFLGGVLSAVAIVGITRGTLAPQLLAIVNGFDPALTTQAGFPNWTNIFEAFLMLFGVLAVLFVFHHRNKGLTGATNPQAWLDGLSSAGQIFIGITFGALFVGLFSSGLTALIYSISGIINLIKLWL